MQVCCLEIIKITASTIDLSRIHYKIIIPSLLHNYLFVSLKDATFLKLLINFTSNSSSRGICSSNNVSRNCIERERVSPVDFGLYILFINLVEFLINSGHLKHSTPKRMKV